MGSVGKSESAMADIVTGINRIGLKLDVEQIGPFLENHSKDEVMRRFTILHEWMIRANAWTNLDGVILTPKLIGFLSQKGDFESLLGELDRYREETRNGRFKIDNEIQRELEFKRFVTSSNSSFIHPSTFPRWTLIDPVPEPDDLPRLFSELEDLPPPEEQQYVPSEQDLLEVKRAAYEAALFLQMLKEFRDHTSRPIFVVGNERYGRQWVIEPIEEHLDDRLAIRYARVNSGASMRLTVPRPFSREVVRDMSERMPHLVIVDGANWPRRNTYSRPERLHDVMRCSRAMRGYANWLVAFNDLRAKGDVSKYQHESSLPKDHIPELRKWYEFATVRQELREWTTPGQTYKVTVWGPELRENVLLGDIDVVRKHVELAGDRPLAVLANTNIYREKGEDIASALKGTTVHYFDEPNRRVKETIQLGFGSHGFETRVNGPTTASFVAVMQRHIKAEVARLVEHPSELSFPG